MSNVYAVYSTGESGDYLIGYYQGTRKDIEVALDHKKGYGLRFEEVRPIVVTSETSEKIKDLLRQKARAEAQIKLADVELRKLGVSK